MDEVKLQIANYEGRIWIIDYILNRNCKCELNAESRLNLENVKYSCKVKIDELNTAIHPD